MSRILEEFRRDDVRVLDHLVDGELSERDRRELLASLDDEPGAWRRCALAFLEDQALGRDLTAIRACPIDANIAEPNSIRPRRASTPWTRFCAIGLALAASLLLAFGLGTLFPGAGPQQMVSGGGKSDGSIAADSPNRLVAKTDGNSANAPPRLQTFKLAVDDGHGGDPQDIELPFLEASSVDPQWLDEQSSAIPAALRQALEQSGLEVRQERRLWPITLDDGRRLIVPLEQVELQKASAQTY